MVTNEGKEKKKKEWKRRKRKATVALLVFITATLDAKGPFDDNGIKNQARDSKNPRVRT